MTVSIVGARPPDPAPGKRNAPGTERSLGKAGVDRVNRFPRKPPRYDDMSGAQRRERHAEETNSFAHRKLRRE